MSSTLASRSPLVPKMAATHMIPPPPLNLPPIPAFSFIPCASCGHLTLCAKHNYVSWSHPLSPSQANVIRTVGSQAFEMLCCHVAEFGDFRCSVQNRGNFVLMTYPSTLHGTFEERVALYICSTYVHSVSLHFYGYPFELGGPVPVPSPAAACAS